jgi:hypothetical protein
MVCLVISYVVDSYYCNVNGCSFVRSLVAEGLNGEALKGSVLYVPRRTRNRRAAPKKPVYFFLSGKTGSRFICGIIYAEIRLYSMTVDIIGAFSVQKSS